MVHLCPNCHKALEHKVKYCSSRCAREVRRQRLRISAAALASFVLLAIALSTSPRNGLQPEPRAPLSLAELQKLALEDSCSICAGKGKVDCKVCIAGKIFYMGTSADCSRCNGKGWIICPACKGKRIGRSVVQPRRANKLLMPGQAVAYRNLNSDFENHSPKEHHHD